MAEHPDPSLEPNDGALIAAVSELYLTRGLLRCAWHAADDDNANANTIEGIRQTIEVAAEKVGIAMDRLERLEISARVRLKA